ncbi:MAG: selenocysteine-specific translation elongation factor [Thermoanaerobaculia bacterium]|nr:selenocysteine-specific translation elongation factor [Thermoanaerobaculia bacterium]
MKRVVVGTAGHIDHGKTRLLEALTGVDCDRWAEEKARGITIDLGFTHLAEPDLQVGFVDIPGHQKFLHNALAGLGGIRLMMLVVAADEGVELQTREHLDVCQLLEIPHGLVVLTKRDLVDDEMLGLARLEVEELLEGSRFEGIPIVEVSSTTGQGIDELRQALLAIAREIAVDGDAADPCRLPVDRAFQLKGLGAVVTGTLVSGRIEPGQTLDLLPRGEGGRGVEARVRSIQVHGENRATAEAGERTALQLTGVGLDDLERGEQLVTQNIFAPTQDLAGRVRLLPDAPKIIKGWIPIRFHLFAHEVMGKLRPLDGPLEPGAEGKVELRLAQPVVAVRGDRFVFRRPSPPLTLGGGLVLDPAWRRRRGGDVAPALRQLATEEDALVLWTGEAAERGVVPEHLTARLGCRTKDIARRLGSLSKEGRLLKVPGGQEGRWLHPETCREVSQRAKLLLQEFFEQHRLAPGMPKAEFLARLLPAAARELGTVYLRMLEAEKTAQVTGDVVNLPGRKVEGQLTGEEGDLSRRLLESVESEGLTPPSPGELAHRLGAKAQIVEGVLKFLVQQKRIVRLPGGLLVSRKAVDEVATWLQESDWDSFSVPRFKDRFGLSRKWAIPLLEQLDSERVTLRVGDERKILGR